MMRPDIQKALESDLVIDMTTIGRTSGLPRTVEIWFHNLGGRYYITGWPGSRDWYANLLRDPRLTIRFSQSKGLELAAVAAPVTDPAQRREILDAVFETEGGESRGDFESWMTGSPIIEFTPQE